MSFLAANLSQEVNGVSWLHGEVSREIFKGFMAGVFTRRVTYQLCDERSSLSDLDSSGMEENRSIYFWRGFSNPSLR